jgi:hypothetical protein
MELRRTQRQALRTQSLNQISRMGMLAGLFREGVSRRPSKAGVTGWKRILHVIRFLQFSYTGKLCHRHGISSIDKNSSARTRMQAYLFKRHDFVLMAKCGDQWRGEDIEQKSGRVAGVDLPDRT